VEEIKDPEAVGDREQQGEVIEGIGHHHVGVREERLSPEKIRVPEWEVALGQLVLEERPEVAVLVQEVHGEISLAEDQAVEKSEEGRPYE